MGHNSEDVIELVLPPLTEDVRKKLILYNLF